MSADKKYLIAINTIMTVVFIFFEVFFGIYVYDISKNINLVLFYSIFKLISFILITLIVAKVINRKMMIVMFKLSFVFAVLSIFMTLLISPNALYMIFITQFLFALTEACYYLPFEVAIMDKNSKMEMDKFVGIMSSLSLIVATLSPFLSGLIIDLASYLILFSILIVLTILCFIFSTKVNFNGEEIVKIGLKAYIKAVNTKKGNRITYFAYSLFKMANDQVVSIFLPILIYLKMETNFSVGLYSSLASLLAGIFVLISSKLFTKNKPLVMWINTIFQIFVSILILVSSSIQVFFIYFFVKKITSAILKNGVHASIFNLPKNSKIESNLVEHFCGYSIVNACSVIFILIISLIIYNLINNVVAITIVLAAISLLQVVSTILLNWGDKELRENDYLLNEKISE